LRTPGRLIIWVTLGLCLLATGAVARIYQELRLARGTSSSLSPISLRRPITRRSVTAVAMAVLPLLLGALPAAAIVVEGLGRTPHWRVAPSPVKLDSLRAPVLLLPTDVVGDYHMMLWSTQGWPVLANGSSGFDARQQVVIRRAAQSFPDAGSVAELRAHGVLTVVIIRSRAVGSVWQGAADRPVTGLPLTRRALGDAVVYDLR
jgi:hypothetical protein